ncbi:potassium channel family protein [Histidinibacterium aquaticum]|uniref:TrkA family potassium uptake protein n=1 Tax=Histidinibacterium aquaticum TaxID=2613962 RepID=A0A5J5GSG5_9RHOB|nr:TrkA family potassium uptake protein [Histidinibacterium aquaticum]KAA9010494.1 TrkA family potassium uptake protein [Histidinibacterium aquaticum]
MARKNRSIAVLGLGNFGAMIATELARFGNDVVGIDIDRKIVSDHAEKLSQALILDVRDEAALREAGVGDCEVAVVAMASDIEASILSVMNLRLLGVKQIWAKAVSRTHHRILSKLGVDRVVHPEEEIGRSLAQMIHNPLIRDLASLGNGNYVVNFIVPESLAGQRLDELDLPAKHDVRAIGVMRGSDWLGGETCATPLDADDKLILLGTRPKLRTFAEGL